MRLPFQRGDGDRPELLIVVSDTHVNSTVGLCPLAGIELDDEGRYLPSPAQKWLWGRWREFWQHVQIVRSKTNARRVLVVHNGDGPDMNVHSGWQLATLNKASIIDATVQAHQPMRAGADVLFYTRGTEAHTGRAANLEEQVAAKHAAEPERDNRYTWYSLPLICGGVSFLLAHHPPSGSLRPWTRNAAGERSGSIVLFDYAEERAVPPDVAVYSHYHRFADSGLGHRIRTFITPAWQLATAYSHRHGWGHALADIGGLIFVCQGGRYTVEAVQYRPERRRPWTQPA